MYSRSVHMERVKFLSTLYTQIIERILQSNTPQIKVEIMLNDLKT